MTEHQVIETQDEVMVVATPAPSAQPKNVSLSPKGFEVEINVSPNDEKTKWVGARLRRPSLEDDYEFAKNSATEYRDAGDSEEIVLSDQIAAEKLFEKIAGEVKGYRHKTEDKSRAKDWREYAPIAELIPGSHKAAFIRGMRVASAKYLGDDEDCFVLGGDGTLEVELTIGYPSNPVGKVLFSIPEPSESERTAFESKAMKLLVGKGEKRKTTRTVTDMKACFEFFIELMKRDGARIVGAEGYRATVNGQEFANCSSVPSKIAFLNEVDPVYAVKVIGAALVKYSARLQD